MLLDASVDDGGGFGAFCWQRLRCQLTFGPVQHGMVAPAVRVCCRVGLELWVWSSWCFTQARAVENSCRGWRGEHVVLPLAPLSESVGAWKWCLDLLGGRAGHRWGSRGVKRGARMVGADAEGWRSKPGRHRAAEGLIFQEHRGRTW